MAENIRVACRVRPLNSSELSKGNASVVSFPGDGKTAISLGGRTFNFDHVIQPKATQVEVYDTIAKPIVDDVLNGYNGTIFAYGQTSSGKTFTMEGVLNEPVLQGIIPRIIHDIFEHIYQMDVNLEFHIKVSYFEIYLDKIRDLLDVSKTNLSVHEDKDRVPYVKGATERFVSSPEEVFDVIDEGKANRHVAVTNMNEHSSRSHSIFMITLRQLNTETQKKLHGKLYLVDLAGSEKVAKTGAEGTVLDEAKNINKSLSALGNVINALVENSSHIPYRDSKLTRILQESLGGNARTTMIICCSPAEYNEGETKSTLLFGMRAKTIKNCVTVNEELTADEWRRRFEREKEKCGRMRAIIAALEAELEKWRNGDKVDASEWFTKEQYSTIAVEVEDLESVNPTMPSSTANISALTESGIPPVASSNSLLANYIPPKPSPRPVVASSADLTEAQLQELYKDLDDKDEEINKMSQMISQVKEQMEEQDLLLRSLREEKDSLAAENAKLQTESDSSKEETKEVLQALEELATNYQQKDAEISSRIKEFEEAQELAQNIKTELMEKDSEIQQSKDNLIQLRKKHAEMLGALVRELAELGEAINEQNHKQPSTPTAVAAAAGGFGTGAHIDEEFTKLRLHITKMKSEARVMQNRLKELDEDRTSQSQNLRKTEEEARELRIRVQEADLRISHLNEKVEESESRKRTLQDRIDQMNGDLAMLRANEQVLGGSKQNEILASQQDIQTKLDEELKRQTLMHQQQVKELRDQVSDYEKKNEEQKDQIAHLEFQHQSMVDERTNLQTQHQETKKRLEQLEINEEKRLQAHKDLESLQQTINKELEVLHSQRNLWMQQLVERLNKSKKMNARKQSQKTAVATGEEDTGQVDSNGQQNTVQITDADASGLPVDDDDDGNDALFGGSMAQTAKIAYLENNFSKLNKVHKQLLQSRHEMRNELVRMEKRHKLGIERITILETSLKEAKEGALRDRKRYNHEIDKIREVMRQRVPNRRVAAAQIVKGIRGGHGGATTAIMGGGGAVHPQNAAVSSSQP